MVNHMSNCIKESELSCTREQATAPRRSGHLGPVEHGKVGTAIEKTSTVLCTSFADAPEISSNEEFIDEFFCDEVEDVDFY